jgi:hypothetical protein
MDLFYDIPTLNLSVISSTACLTAYLPAGKAVRAKGIPLGMPRSVDKQYRPVLHPVRDASLTGCKEDTPKYSTERSIPNGMQSSISIKVSIMDLFYGILTLIPGTVYFCELDMRPACRHADEAICDGSSLRGAQRRSNPEIHDFPDCFIPQ